MNPADEREDAESEATKNADADASAEQGPSSFGAVSSDDGATDQEPDELDGAVARFVKDGHAETLGEWFAGKPLGRNAHLVLGLVLPMVVGFVTMWRLRTFTIDDAYISYRYARNLANGLGLVYNAGERIEGYTNFSWTLMLALGAKVGVDPTVSAKVLGFGFGLASIALLFHLEGLLRPLRSMPALAPWLLASTSAFMGYAIFGLETAFFVALVLGGIVLVMRERTRGGVPWSGLVFGIAGITRPEAPMFLGLTMLFMHGPALFDKPTPHRRPLVLTGGMLALCVAVVMKLRQPVMHTGLLLGFWLLVVAGAFAVVGSLPKELFSKKNLLRGSIFVGVVLLHLLWRKSYYGAWVPNTFTAKTGDPTMQIVGGLDYLKKYAAHEGPLAALAALGIGVAIGRQRRWMLGFATMALCTTTYVAIVGGDWMPMHRFATSIQPFAYLVVGLGLRTLVEDRRAQLNWGLALLALAVVGHRGERLEEDRRKILVDEKGFWDRAAGGVAHWFARAEAKRGRETIAGEIALGDIGQVGYETNLPIVDLLGLVDPVVAKLPGGYTHKVGPGFRDYFFQRKPRYFVLISAQNDCVHPSVTGSISIYRDSRFRTAYTVSGRVLLTGGFSWCIYEKNENVDVTEPVLVVDQEHAFTVPRGDFGPGAVPSP